MRLTLDTRNASGLVARFFTADTRAQTAIRAVVRRSGFRTYERALSRMPYRTGFMLQHFQLVFSPDALVYNIGWDEADFTAAGFAFYPVYVEFGTRYMAARPSLFPARDAELPAFRRELRAEVRGALRRRAGVTTARRPPARIGGAARRRS